MAKRSSTKKPRDFSIIAHRVVREATGEAGNVQPIEEKPLNIEGKNPNAVALGRLGGKKGGKARAAKLTPKQRQEIARKAAKARWGRGP